MMVIFSSLFWFTIENLGLDERAPLLLRAGESLWQQVSFTGETVGNLEDDDDGDDGEKDDEVGSCDGLD